MNNYWNPTAMKSELFSKLRLPLIVSPMFLVSGVDLVVACCKAGVVGSFPALNARSTEAFEAMIVQIQDELAAYSEANPTAYVAPFAVNVTIRMLADARNAADMDVICRHKVPVVITSVGDPAAVVDRIHSYGGLVLHDVTTLRHARKAASANVDGLILVCAGAGGHAGTSSPFALVPQVRKFFDKLVILGGGISEGRAVRAAEILGADLAYAGTRFIATRESQASDAYKDMLVAQATHEIVYTPAFSGVPANYLRASITNAGMDPDNLPAPKGLWQPDLPKGVKPWRDIWSAGHGVGLIEDAPAVGELVERMRAEYDGAALA
jgi:nitronate monooxygenase